MMSALEQLFSLLAKHAPLVSLLFEAIDGGVSHDSLVKAIKAEMTAASDELMKRELPK